MYRFAEEATESVLMAVSAAGNVIPPLLIFKGKRLPSNLLHDAPAGSVATVSESAFIDLNIFNLWIDHFVYHIPSARPVLLTLDNHSSHVALNIRKKCLDNGIHILAFPPHMTHLLQPLDAGRLRSFKSQWRKEIDEWSVRTRGRALDRDKIAGFIGKTMTISLTLEMIQNSWKSTAVWPINVKEVDLNVLSKDTKSTSSFAQYELHDDPLPIESLDGRSIRRLERDGIDLKALRSFKLNVKDV